MKKGKKYAVDDGPLWKYRQTQKKIMEIQDPYAKTLFTTLYLTAARRGEIRELRKKNFFIEKNQEKRFLYIKCPVFKNRKDHFKFVPISLEKEKPYVRIIHEWVRQFENEERIFSSQKKPSVPISADTIYRWCMHYFGFNPHWFRKLRITHWLNGDLPNTSPIPDHIVRRLSGWSDTRQLKTYDKYRYTDTSRFL